MVCLIIFLENEVDGEAFMYLTAEDISAMVKALGARRKLLHKQALMIKSHKTRPCPESYRRYVSIIIL